MDTALILNQVISFSMIALVFYMFYRVFFLQKRNKLNNKLLNILGKIEEPDEFFKEADEFIATEKNQEFITKIKVLRLWADAIYEKYDQFDEHLNSIDYQNVMVDSKGKDIIKMNEDTFFYLLVAIPNRLYLNEKQELIKLLDEKMTDVPDDLLLKEIHKNAMKLYMNQEDYGQQFFENVLNGEYAGYAYSKQLIGMYKSCITCYLAKIALIKNDTEKFATYEDDLRTFSESHLGTRMLKEMRIQLEEKVETEEAE